MKDDFYWDNFGRDQKERYEYRHRPAKCPACGSTRVAKILYGMPILSEGLQRDLEEGRVVLGGCELGDAVWECADCHVVMHRKLNLPPL